MGRVDQHFKTFFFSVVNVNEFEDFAFTVPGTVIPDDAEVAVK